MYKKEKKTLIIWASLILFGVLADIGTTHYSGQGSLKYEGNALFLKYHWGWLELIIWLFLYGFFFIAFYGYFIYKYRYSSLLLKAKTVKITIIIYFFGTESLPFVFESIKTFKISLLHFCLSILNYYAYLEIRILFVIKMRVCINNILLGIVLNESRTEKIGKKIEIILNKSFIWDTHLGDIALKYYLLPQKNILLIENYIIYFFNFIIFFMFWIQLRNKTGFKQI